MTEWRNCKASLALLAEVNALWPNRDKASDGTIGDAAHATRDSDHNPWMVVDGIGVVRARDIDRDGIDAPWLAEYLRLRGVIGDRRLCGGGYIIWNGRITLPDFSGWKPYTGTNPHTAHIHVSFSRDPAGFDSTASWCLTAAAPAAPAGVRVLRLVDPPMRGDDVTAVQRVLAAWYGLAGSWVDGIYGPGTVEVVKRAQANTPPDPVLTADGVVGPATRAKLGIS